MKSKKDFPAKSAVTEKEVQRAVKKSTAILLRTTADERESIKQAAKSVKLTATEYLVKCHELVSSKLGGK